MELSELFENPKALLIIPFLLLVLFYKGREWAARVSSLRAFRASSKARQILFVAVPYWFLWAMLFLASVALANPQSKTLEPRTYATGYRVGITVDDSGSMSGKKIEMAKQAVIDLIRKRPNDVFSFVPFGGTALLSSGIKFTSDRGLVIDAVSRLEGTAGSTAIGDGYLAEFVFLLNDVIPVDPETGRKKFSVEFERLKSSLESHDAEGARYHEEVWRRMGRIEGGFIIGATDGGNNAGIDPDRVIEYMTRFGVPAFLISVENVQNPKTIRLLKKSGGGYFFADSEKEIKAMMEKIDALKPVRVEKGFTEARLPHRPLIAKMNAILFSAVVILWALGLRIR